MVLEAKLEGLAEELFDVALVAPGERGAHTRDRGRLVRRHHLEHPTYSSVRRPVCKRDPPAGRVTRPNSRAVAAWAGANMIPQVEETTSKAPSATPARS